MTKRNKIAKIVSVSLLSASPAISQSLPSTPLQDSAKAVEFFQNELEFKTNPHGVKAALDGKADKITIVDVRAAKDYAEGHIPGAINIPYEKYESFDGAETEFPGLRKDRYNVVYCYRGVCSLSSKAAKKFASLGYPVKEMSGGFEQWKLDKHAIEK